MFRPDYPKDPKHHHALSEVSIHGADSPNGTALVEIQTGNTNGTRQHGMLSPTASPGGERQMAQVHVLLQQSVALHGATSSISPPECTPTPHPSCEPLLVQLKPAPSLLCGTEFPVRPRS